MAPDEGNDVQVRADDPLSSALVEARQAAPDDLPGLLVRMAAVLGAECAVAYLCDREQNHLVPLLAPAATANGEASGPATTPRESLSIDSTLAGRAFVDIDVHVSRGADDAGFALWLPMLDGTERIGVLELRFPDGFDPDDRELRRRALGLASLMAELVMTKAAYGDWLEIVRRRLPMSVAAEMQWTMLPPLTFGTHNLVISGVLSPCYEVAGDTFDYALNRNVAHLAVFDAMGHGMSATLLSSVALGVYRNGRRSGLDLVTTVRSIDKWLSVQFEPGVFVTAIIAELDTTTGFFRWVNAGHPPALLLRGGRIVKTLDQHTSPPLALIEEAPVVCEERLEPGDRLVLYTDGVIEARDEAGEFFGIERLAEYVTREEAAGRAAPETLRRLNAAVLAHQEGELQDDATVLLVEWLGGGVERLVPDSR